MLPYVTRNLDEALATVAAHSPSTVPTYTDPWAGNPDTDKHWGKNR